MREPQFQDQIALDKREESLDLIAAWAPATARILLKTDLFEEGFGRDRLLDALATRYPGVVGMDISYVVASEARRRIPGPAYLRDLPCALT